MSVLVKSCSFCNRPVAKGSGTMLAKNDGTVLWSCSSKCKKNLEILMKKYIQKINSFLDR